ncbi:hypothetical protein Taro_024963 [Colocasia esculenta]|uniref:Uncharacterized protein n=1 Tax=Colocasia esculenta TaxID=4460 RepID=A0A843V7M8_COLES|nr:hypothetical protein [Colocasia esculenta]
MAAEESQNTGGARRPQTTSSNHSRTMIMEAPLMVRQLEDCDRKLPAISATKSVNGNLERTSEHDFNPLTVNRTDGATIKGGGISHNGGTTLGDERSRSARLSLGVTRLRPSSLL